MVSATNWSNNPGVAIANGDYVLVWQDTIDNLYYCIKSGSPALRWVHATLDSALVNEAATTGVTTTSAFDGGTHPGAVTVNNTWGCSAKSGDVCLVVQDATGTYELVQVKHYVRTLINNVEYDQATHALRSKIQQITAMHEADAGAFVAYHSAVETDIVTDINWNSPNLEETLRASAYVLEAPADATATALSFTTKTFVADVYMSGIDLHKKKRTLLTPEAGAITDSTVFQGTLCNTTPALSPSPSRAQQAAIMQAGPTSRDQQNFIRPSLPQ